MGPLFISTPPPPDDPRLTAMTMTDIIATVIDKKKVHRVEFLTSELKIVIILRDYQLIKPS